jgi:hypothetical protein
MQTPQLLTDIANVMMLLAPSAALLCLVLAGISLRRDTGGVNFAIGGGFTKWMFWAVIFVTLPGLLIWFSNSGVSVPSLGGGISSAWLSSFETSMSSFVQNLVMARMVLVLAAFMGLRAILDMAEGESPLPSVLAAFFLLGVQTTYTLLQQYNSGTQYAITDVLASLWTYLASVIMPTAAGLGIFAAIIKFALGKPAMRLVGVSLALLCVSGLWALLQAMAQ